MTTWNPLDKASSVGLTNGNLTATFTTTSTVSVRSTLSKPGGKWYFEAVAQWAAGGSNIAGIMTAAANINLGPGSSTPSCGIFWSGSAWFISNNASSTSLGGTAVNGDVIGICLDNSAGFIYATKNGIALLGNPVAGTGGSAITVSDWFAACGGSHPVSTTVMTAKFADASGFSFGPPSGFLGWDPQNRATIGVNTLEMATRRTYRVVGI